MTTYDKCDDDFYTANFDDIAHPRSVLNLCETKLWLYDIPYLTSTAFVSVTSYNRVDIDCNPVHYGVVYAYKYENNVAQLQSYDMHGIVRNDNKHTTSQTYDDVVNYGVNGTIRSNNSDMNLNNNGSVKVDSNCHYDDKNNILFFYLPWKQV